MLSQKFAMIVSPLYLRELLVTIEGWNNDPQAQQSWRRSRRGDSRTGSRLRNCFQSYLVQDQDVLAADLNEALLSELI